MEAARETWGGAHGARAYVSFDGEPGAPPGRLSRMRQFEAVIVVWTEHSVQNAGLNDIARALLPLNLLVPVRAEDLDTARILPAFRKLNMILPARHRWNIPARRTLELGCLFLARNGGARGGA